MVAAKGSSEHGLVASVRSLLSELDGGRPRAADTDLAAGLIGDDPCAARLREARGDIQTLRDRLARLRREFPDLTVSGSDLLEKAAHRAGAPGPWMAGREPGGAQTQNESREVSS